MNARALNRTHVSALTLAIVASVVLLTAVACIPPGHGANGPDPEDLTAIAAVLNKTAGALTVTVSDPLATDVLDPGEAIFYEVRQGTEAREFEFVGGEGSANGSLRLLTGRETPGFATGVLMVGPGQDNETLSVDSCIESISPFALHREALAPGSSIFLIVNDTPNNIGVETPGAGAMLRPTEHTAVVVAEGATLAVTIESWSGADAQELPHAFEAPGNANGQVSAFIALVTFQGNELDVETQSAGFRRLE